MEDGASGVHYLALTQTYPLTSAHSNSDELVYHEQRATICSTINDIEGVSFRKQSSRVSGYAHNLAGWCHRGAYSYILHQRIASRNVLVLIY